MAVVPGWVNGVDYDAAGSRVLDAFFMVSGDDGVDSLVGVRPGGGLEPSVSSGDWRLSPGVGTVKLSGTSACYRVGLDLQSSDTIPAADSVNPRTDILVLQLHDDDVDGSGDKDCVASYITGTAAPSPSQPSTPDGAILIGVYTVPADGQGSPTVVDARSFAVASGGVLPCDTEPSTPYPGQPIYKDGALRVYDGSDWSAAGPAVQDLASQVSAGSGFEVTLLKGVVANGWAQLRFTVTRTGGAIGPSGGGNIPNTTLLSGLPDAFVPSDGDMGWFATLAGSYGAFGLVRSNATLYMTAFTNDAAELDSGQYITGCASYPV